MANHQALHYLNMLTVHTSSDPFLEWLKPGQDNSTWLVANITGTSLYSKTVTYVPGWIRGTREDQDQYKYWIGSLQQSVADPKSNIHRIQNIIICDSV